MRKRHNNNKVWWNELLFDSEEELEYYQYLLKLKEQGTIVAVDRQTRLILQPKYRLDGTAHPAITYTPDFAVTFSSGFYCLIEFKGGLATTQALIKRSMYRYLSLQPSCPFFGVELRWVSKSKKWGNEDGWIDYDELMKKRRAAKKMKEALKAV